MTATAATCPWCSAPRDAGPACPRCGANYAKAEQIKAHGRAVAAPAALPSQVQVQVQPEADLPVQDSLDGLPLVDDPALEWKFCLAAIPAALVFGVLFHVVAPFLQRTFLAMPVHELGHAASAWFTGHWAIPTLWKTLSSEERGFVTPLVLAGALGFLVYRSLQMGHRALAALGVAMLLVQAWGTLLIGKRTADMLIVFGGDGIGMVLATALMASFFFGKTTQLYRGSLRWGFLVIGAGAFVDLFSTWWRARSDFGAVPFGEQEGVGLSDPTKLVDAFGWDTAAMIRRYVTLGIVCLVALALVYAWGVRQARKRMAEAPGRPGAADDKSRMA
jgi:hypothetical protein